MRATSPGAEIAAGDQNEMLTLEQSETLEQITTASIIVADRSVLPAAAPQCHFVSRAVPTRSATPFVARRKDLRAYVCHPPFPRSPSRPPAGLVTRDRPSCQ